MALNALLDTAALLAALDPDDTAPRVAPQLTPGQRDLLAQLLYQHTARLEALAAKEPPQPEGASDLRRAIAGCHLLIGQLHNAPAAAPPAEAPPVAELMSSEAPALAKVEPKGVRIQATWKVSELAALGVELEAVRAKVVATRGPETPGPLSVHLVHVEGPRLSAAQGEQIEPLRALIELIAQGQADKLQLIRAAQTALKAILPETTRGLVDLAELAEQLQQAARGYNRAISEKAERLAVGLRRLAGREEETGQAAAERRHQAELERARQEAEREGYWRGVAEGKASVPAADSELDADDWRSIRAAADGIVNAHRRICHEAKASPAEQLLSEASVAPWKALQAKIERLHDRSKKAGA
jgi:hypothetical protein